MAKPNPFAKFQAKDKAGKKPSSGDVAKSGKKTLGPTEMVNIKANKIMGPKKK